jgi:hypothetical protein
VSQLESGRVKVFGHPLPLGQTKIVGTNGGYGKIETCPTQSLLHAENTWWD